mmetsp:Transcript_121044/g.349723  ORF Transcript_121044/g.349723 Transcript_121044/m.349723 type:complete len:252 (-) Transcript_121044:1011-1766(-)
MAPVLGQLRRLADVSHELRQRNDRHVGELRALFRRVAGEPPREEERATYVVVGGAEVLVDDSMDDDRHSVHEDHHLVLQSLCDLSEVLEVTQAEYRINVSAWNHGVQIGCIVAFHVLGDDLGPCLAETEGEQRADLDDRLLEHDGLHGIRVAARLLRLLAAESAQRLHEQLQAHANAGALRERLAALRDLVHGEGTYGALALARKGLFRLAFGFPTLPVADGHRGQGIVPDLVDVGDHPLDGLEHILVGVV